MPGSTSLRATFVLQGELGLTSVVHKPAHPQHCGLTGPGWAAGDS